MGRCGAGRRWRRNGSEREAPAGTARRGRNGGGRSGLGGGDVNTTSPVRGPLWFGGTFRWGRDPGRPSRLSSRPREANGGGSQGHCSALPALKRSLRFAPLRAAPVAMTGARWYGGPVGMPEWPKRRAAPGRCRRDDGGAVERSLREKGWRAAGVSRPEESGKCVLERCWVHPFCRGGSGLRHGAFEPRWSPGNLRPRIYPSFVERPPFFSRASRGIAQATGHGSRVVVSPSETVTVLGTPVEGSRTR